MSLPPTVLEPSSQFSAPPAAPTEPSPTTLEPTTQPSSLPHAEPAGTSSSSKKRKRSDEESGQAGGKRARTAKLSRRTRSHHDSSHYRFICEQCGSGFPQKGELARHIPIHLPPEMKAAIGFKCPYAACSYSALQRNNLKSHFKRKHSKDTLRCRELICGEEGPVKCGAVFAKHRAFCEHALAVHGILRPERPLAPSRPNTPKSPDHLALPDESHGAYVADQGGNMDSGERKEPVPVASTNQIPTNSTTLSSSLLSSSNGSALGLTGPTGPLAYAPRRVSSTTSHRTVPPSQKPLAPTSQPHVPWVPFSSFDPGVQRAQSSVYSRGASISQPSSSSYAPINDYSALPATFAPFDVSAHPHPHQPFHAGQEFPQMTSYGLPDAGTAHSASNYLASEPVTRPPQSYAPAPTQPTQLVTLPPVEPWTFSELQNQDHLLTTETALPEPPAFVPVTEGLAMSDDRAFSRELDFGSLLGLNFGAGDQLVSPDFSGSSDGSSTSSTPVECNLLRILEGLF
ncbi:hypothetical protein CERSUDRAFT_99474 [Gelatoporia subvermispora B]|uniref:C2H2-type domain-containing protein n=1 Tax=Ceriporiopsis subvermispora (strain B) TaxID=914234 RepID=M2R0L1_CERS8|nr:hypothetical protein CERSUDRAFT_99474 [Gelatoporia subvermispora B]